MGEDAIQSTEYVGQVPQACLRATACLGTQRKATWKMLWRCEDVGGPIERMAAVVNRAAGARSLYWIQSVRRSGGDSLLCFAT